MLRVVPYDDRDTGRQSVTKATREEGTNAAVCPLVMTVLTANYGASSEIKRGVTGKDADSAAVLKAIERAGELRVELRG